MTDEARGRQRLAIEQLLKQYDVPVGLWDGVVLYLQDGIRAGDFLNAVCENNFAEAVTRADIINYRSLRDIALFFLNCVPDNLWGSKTAVNNWVTLNANERQRNAKEGSTTP